MQTKNAIILTWTQGMIFLGNHEAKYLIICMFCLIYKGIYLWRYQPSNTYKESFLEGSKGFCQRIWVLFKGNDFNSKEHFPVKGYNFFSKEIVSWYKKCFPVKGNDSLSDEIISWRRKNFFPSKLFPLNSNYSLSKNIKFLSIW